MLEKAEARTLLKARYGPVRDQAEAFDAGAVAKGQADAA
jgi:hypothetical protein